MSSKAKIIPEDIDDMEPELDPEFHDHMVKPKKEKKKEVYYKK